MSADEIKILLVDDHPMMRDGVHRMLAEQPGFRVVGEAASSRAALDQVRRTGPDVVVMDIHMPDADRLETSARILAEFPEVRIVVLSADTDLTTIQRALQARVLGYITKNSPPEEIVEAIREAMDQRIYLAREVASVVAQDYMNLIVGRSEAAKPVLTARERLLVKLVAEGKRNKEIAEVLQVGVSSVDTYRSRLMRKLKCRGTSELTRYAIREGIACA